LAQNYPFVTQLTLNETSHYISTKLAFITQ
jgi:hypothetical protein